MFRAHFKLFACDILSNFEGHKSRNCAKKNTLKVHVAVYWASPTKMYLYLFWSYGYPHVCIQKKMFDRRDS